MSGSGHRAPSAGTPNAKEPGTFRLQVRLANFGASELQNVSSRDVQKTHHANPSRTSHSKINPKSLDLKKKHFDGEKISAKNFEKKNFQKNFAERSRNAFRERRSKSPRSKWTGKNVLNAIYNGCTID